MVEDFASEMTYRSIAPVLDKLAAGPDGANQLRALQRELMLFCGTLAQQPPMLDRLHEAKVAVLCTALALVAERLKQMPAAARETQPDGMRRLPPAD